MKKSLSILVLFSFLSSISFAQLENANWCFGINASVNFIPSPATSTSSYQPIVTQSCPSVSSQSGQLLFYSDGSNVYGSNHQVITNGTGIYGYNNFGMQNAVIVPKPGNPSIYYLFTIGATSVPTSGNEVGRGGIHYTVIDMSSGYGEIDPLLKNIPLKNTAGTQMDYDFHDQNNPMFLSCKSRITTTLNSTGDKIWVTIIAVYYSQSHHSRVFYNYLVDLNGIGGVADGTIPGPAVESNSVFASNYTAGNTFTIGSMKISPSGLKLCDAEESVVNLYSYNNATGTMTYDRTIYNNTSVDQSVGYGVEFSPSNNMIYFTANPFYIIQDGLVDSVHNSNTYGSIYQYDISTERLRLVYNHSPSQDLVPIPATGGWGLQLAIDGKIYVCTGQYRYHLSAIKNPDDPYPNCNYDPTFLPLAANTANSNELPQWVHRATVNTIWPKVYLYAQGSDPTPDNWNRPWLIVGNGSSIFFGVTTHDMTNNVNHNGGTVPTSPGVYTAQYDKTTGITSWINQNMLPKFALSSGVLQGLTSPFTSPATSISTAYYDPATGNTVSGPSNVPGNEIILAEDNGTYITRSTNSLHIHSSSGNTSTSFISGANGIYRTVYNPATQHLFVQYQTNLAMPLAVYGIINNTLTLINTPSQSPSGYLQQVNSNDEPFYLAYYSGYLRVARLDFNTNILTPLTLAGFNNTDMALNFSCNLYAEDKILVVPAGENYMYAINTVTYAFKKVSCSYGTHDPHGLNYHFEGNDLFLEVATDGQVLIIGNQTIPTLGSASTGVTKFNIVTDFSRPTTDEGNIQTIINENGPSTVSKPSFGITLTPNPVKQILQVNIDQIGNKLMAIYLVSITDGNGFVMLRKEAKSGRLDLDVSQFKTGIYYITVSNGKDNKLTKIFMKL